MCTPSDPYAKVYTKADKALYSVKQNGKNGLSFYMEETDSGESSHPDMNRLVDGIHRSGSYKGALDVEYRQFAKLYEYISNLEKRYEHPFKLIIITLEAAEDETPSIVELEKAMFSMEQSIRQTIRNVDVVTRYGRDQFLIILLGADNDGVKAASDRIFRGYYKMESSSVFSPTFAIAYSSENN
jgi:hypothetical protein